jgi:hypothetical protein
MGRGRVRDEVLGDVHGEAHGGALPEALADDCGCWLKARVFHVAGVFVGSFAAISAGDCRCEGYVSCSCFFSFVFMLTPEYVKMLY